MAVHDVHIYIPVDGPGIQPASSTLRWDASCLRQSKSPRSLLRCDRSRLVLANGSSLRPYQMAEMEA